MLDIILQIAGLAIGLVYLYYEYHANSKVWIAGLFMPMISMFVYFRKGLYADFGMNIYYLLMAIYGYLAWTGIIGRSKDAEESSAPDHSYYSTGFVARGGYYSRHLGGHSCVSARCHR